MANDYFNFLTPLSEHTLARGRQVNDLFRAVEAGFAILPSAAGFTNNLNGYYTDDSAAANIILLTPSPVLLAYTQGAMVRWKAKIANTGPVVLNLSSLGNVNLVRNNGAALVAGDIPINSMPVAIYSGTVFMLISSSALDVTAAAAYAASAAASAATATTQASNALASATAAAASAASIVNGVATHAALTATHGVSGAIVGTTDAQALTNKTISGGANTLTNIGNSSLTNNGVTIGGVTIALGAAGLANVENKSSASIRSELTKANIDAARGMTVAGVISGTSANSGRISWGTGAPGVLAEGEIYLRYT